MSTDVSPDAQSSLPAAPDSTAQAGEAAPTDMGAALTKPHRFLYVSNFEDLLATLSPAERLLLYIFTTALAIATLALLAGVNAKTSVVVPAPGGALTEGVVGSARFINPLLAISAPDRDLAYLVYSGLTRISPNGSIIPDLASSYEISDDGLTYTFTLRPDLTFHDEAPITTSDVLFTIHTAQNPDIKSPHRADWEGVTVSAPDSHTIIFTLPRPYAPFLENTALGILPAHLWQNVTVEEFPFAPFNTKPIGSGPYQVNNVEIDKTGVATRYDLVPFNKFTLGTPYLEKITFLFFANETTLVDAWNAGRVDSFAGVSPSELSHLGESEIRIIRAPLPRIFGVFLNQGHAPIFADSAVRAALDVAVDKKALVDSVLGGYGAPLQSPIPPGIFSRDRTTPENSVNAEDPFNGIEKARDILLQGDWEFNEEERVWQKDEQNLAFALATSDSPELSETAEILANSWRAVGIQIDVHVYPISELNAAVIRPRAYDAILFGEVVGRSLDLFAFWHSSQRNDPGLNLAMYTNVSADTILAKARGTTNRRERESLYESFAETIREERPAIFLYAPQLLYVLPSKIRGVELGTLTNPGERFSGVYQWFINTEHVWSIFTNISE